MAITFRTSGQNADDASNLTIAVGPLSVTAGDIVACWHKFEGAATTLTTSDGTNAASLGTMTDHANGDLHGRWTYYVSSVGGSLTFTSTLGVAKQWKRMHVWVFNPNGGTPSFDTEATGSGTGAGTEASGTFTTTGTDEVVLGGFCEYDGITPTNPLVNGVAADGSILDATFFTSSWYKILGSTFSNGTVSVDWSSGAAWIVNALAIKVTAGGAAARPMFRGS